jgi:DNA-binding MarR family transcriptional regulator
MDSNLPCACTALRKASRAVTRVFDEQLARHGMTTTQFAMLRNLAREGQVPLSRLAELLVMERTTLYRALAPIERKGWIMVTPGDRGRAKDVALAPAGRAAMEAAEPDWRAMQNDLVGAMGAPEWQDLEARLREMTILATQRSRA